MTHADRENRSRKAPWLRIVVDASMTLLYLVQMLPGKIGNPVHELAGIALAALFVVHHVLNHGWMHRLGVRQGFRARFVLVSDLVLTLCMVGMVGTGVLMSRSALPWLAVPRVAHVVRPLHGACAYAGLMLLSMHVGLHARVLRGYVGLHGKATSLGMKTVIALVVAFAFGGWAFMRLGVAGKLAGSPSFPDGMTPLGVQLVLHLALCAPFVVMGSLVEELTRARGNQHH